MDLALHFGIPADELARRMTEREFSQWATRARRQWLPARRFEWYLASIVQAIAATMGGAKDASVDDFMLRLEPPGPEPDLDDAKEFFEFSPVKKKS